VDPEAARHDPGARTLEDAQLRSAVRVEAPVAVEVVGLEVEQHGDVAGERLDVLELEARELADDPRAVLRHAGGLGECARDRARDLAPPAGRTEDRPEQLRGRGLAVRAGY